MAEAALNAGKHVVIEKPFTPTSKEAAKLIEIANAKGLILSVFHNKRLENDFLTLKKILDHKLVGDAVTLSWNYDRYRTHITHKNWKEKKVPGAGTLYDLGVHLIDATLSLLGAPNAVTAHTRILRNGGESTDYFTIRLDYQQLTVHLSSSTMVREQGPQLVLHGTLGSYVKYGTDPQENQLKIGLRPGMNGWGEESSELNGILHTEINGELIREKYPSVKSCYEHFYTNIFDAIRLKNALMVKPEQALLAIQIIELAEKSNTEHRTVYLSEHESVS
jgi:predicted dehydrogenase